MTYSTANAEAATAEREEAQSQAAAERLENMRQQEAELNAELEALRGQIRDKTAAAARSREEAVDAEEVDEMRAALEAVMLRTSGADEAAS